MSKWLKIRVWIHLNICRRLTPDSKRLFSWAGCPYVEENISAWKCKHCKITGWVDKDKKTHWISK
jgi:hypothetical protein